MSEIALAAAYRAIGNRLRVSGKVWGDRVYADFAGSNDTFPYVVYYYSGGGEGNRTRQRDANLVINVQCIAESLAQAALGAQQIADLLNDHGAQDNTTDYLDGGTYWYILTVTEEENLHVYDPFAGVKPRFNTGARYRLIMEAK